MARPGAVLPNGLAIKPTKIRGEESAGMLCSESELGISENHDGIIVLPEGHGFEAGADAAKALFCDDVILELGITPNRPDALSHLGVARELCALLGKHFSHPSFDCSERGAPVEQTVRVEIGATQQCPRYACRAIDGVTIAPSPKWLQARLEQCGVKVHQ